MKKTSSQIGNLKVKGTTLRYIGSTAGRVAVNGVVKELKLEKPQSIIRTILGIDEGSNEVYHIYRGFKNPLININQ